MSQHKVRTLPDGTRVYSNYTRYKPIPEAERRYRVRKPLNPDAVRFKGDWFLPLAVLPDEVRDMPETRGDEEAYDHMQFTFNCRCDVCMRPDADRWRRRWKRDNGF